MAMAVNRLDIAEAARNVIPKPLPRPTHDTRFSSYGGEADDDLSGLILLVAASGYNRALALVLPASTGPPRSP